MAVQSSNRLPLLLALVGTILLVVAILHLTNSVPRQWTDSLSKVSGTGMTPAKTAGRRSFYAIALSHGTDKVTSHSYQHIYQKYLEPIRDQPLNLLEIGLGCDMGYGPGASYYTWLEYLLNVDLYYIEYDAKCAEKWANKTSDATIFVGDQADVKFLKMFIAEAGHDFDIIIDDGGHAMDQQITSLYQLWQAVVPGGIYFCKDLQTSYISSFGGNNHNEGYLTTIMGMIEEILDDLNSIPGDFFTKHKISEDMLSVDCEREFVLLPRSRSY